MTGFIAALLILLFFGIGFTPISQELIDIRSDAALESLSCTTGIGETSCDLTLTEAHLLDRAAGITVTETSPGSSAYSNLALAVNQTTLTVGGLTASTAYVFTVDYLTEKTALADNQEFAELLSLTPLLLLVIVIPLGCAALVSLALKTN